MNKVICSLLSIGVVGLSSASLGMQGEDDTLDMENVKAWGPVVMMILASASLVTCNVKNSKGKQVVCVICGLALLTISIYSVVENAQHVNEDDEQDVHIVNIVAAACGIPLGIAMLVCAASKGAPGRRGSPKRRASPVGRAPPARRASPKRR